MARKPVIGITVDYLPEEQGKQTGGKFQLNWNYAEAIARSGGVPLLVPPQADVEQLADLLDGWLIPGGHDIDAAEFGEENHASVETIQRQRYDQERRLYSVLHQDVPILGICYGCQFLNVVRGGTLIQHLPEIVSTVHTDNVEQVHHLRTGSLLQETVGVDAMRGKSSHHQAIKRLGQGLTVTAEHDDGTVEAIEATDRPWVVGVQWHPERSPDDPATRRLFDAFIAQAARYAGRKEAVSA